VNKTSFAVFACWLLSLVLAQSYALRNGRSFACGLWTVCYPLTAGGRLAFLAMSGHGATILVLSASK